MVKLNVSSRTEAHGRPPARAAGRHLTRALWSPPRPNCANSSCAGPALSPRVDAMPIRTVRRRRGGTRWARRIARATRAPGGRGGPRRRGTPPPPPRQPDSTRPSPTARGGRRGRRARQTSRRRCATRTTRDSPSRSRPTGHGAAAPADGTVFVSTRRMQGLQVDPVARVARVEAGVRWRSVIDAAVPHGLAPLSGSSSGVGAVGYTLGWRDGPSRAPPRLRRRPRPDGRARDRRRASSRTVTAEERP